MSKSICSFYLKGTCKYGEKCKFLHPTDVPIQIIDDTTNAQTSQKTTSVCHFFLNNKCNKGNNCPFLHGYCNRLEHLKSIDNHQYPISNLVNMDNIKYISSDEKSFHIRFIGNNQEHGENIAQDYKIGKLIYSSNKVICAIQSGTM